MASLEKRYDGRYRIVFCWQAERHYHSLGKMPEREARSCLDRLEESLRIVSIVGYWKSLPTPNWADSSFPGAS
jgi:hypothetical protein